MGSNSAGGHGCLSLAIVVCFRVEVSAAGRSLVQRSPTDCGLSECDLKTSKMRRLRETRGFQRRKEKEKNKEHPCFKGETAMELAT